MQNEWRVADLPAEAGVNPQVHWINFTVNDDRPVLASLHLSDVAARVVHEAVTGRNAGEDERGTAQGGAAILEIVTHMVISRETIDRLASHVERDDGDGIDVVVVLSAEGWKRLLQAVLESDNDVTLLDAGLGVNPEAVRDSRGMPSTSAQSSRATERGLSGDEVIVAVIDDGIGFANHRFRLSETETRFEYFLGMNVIGRQAGTDGDLGVELDRAMIDDLLKRYGGDEERIYRAVGLIDFREPRETTRFGRSAPLSLAFAQTHGTHVLDVAAGYDWHDAAEHALASKRPIIGVQLPAALVAETSGVGTAVYVEKALNEIGAKAIEMSRRVPRKSGEPVTWLPLIVNLSFGISAGPLDGYGPVERAIDRFIRAYRRETASDAICHVVLPAGNGFHSRSVARVTGENLCPDDPIVWRVKPDDRTASFVDIWLPPIQRGKLKPGSAAGRIAVSLQPPRGGPATSIASAPGKMLEWIVDGTVLARIYHRLEDRPGGAVRENVVVAVRGTEREIFDEPICPSGDWLIRLENCGLEADETVELRIQRDDPRPGQTPRGRQSYFNDSEYHRYIPASGRLPEDGKHDGRWASREGTFNAYANLTDDVIVAGGYRRSDGTPSWYTGSGPTATRDGPDLAAVSEESPSHLGVIGAGTFTGSVFLQNGTSVAAPAVARALADEIASAGSVPAADNLLSRDAANGPRNDYGPVDPARLGKGRLARPEQPAHRQRVFPRQ
ncbi:MAG: hypothetical protein ACMVO3_13430 [Thalassobaculum sp.]